MKFEAASTSLCVLLAFSRDNRNEKEKKQNNNPQTFQEISIVERISLPLSLSLSLRSYKPCWPSCFLAVETLYRRLALIATICHNTKHTKPNTHTHTRRESGESWVTYITSPGRPWLQKRFTTGVEVRKVRRNNRVVFFSPTWKKNPKNQKTRAAPAGKNTGRATTPFCIFSAIRCDPPLVSCTCVCVPNVLQKQIHFLERKRRKKKSPSHWNLMNIKNAFRAPISSIHIQRGSVQHFGQAGD